MLSLFELNFWRHPLVRVTLIRSFGVVFHGQSSLKIFIFFFWKFLLKIQFRQMRSVEMESVRSTFIVSDEPTSHVFTLFCHRTSEFVWMEGKRTKYSSLVGATKYTEIHIHTFVQQRGKSQTQVDTKSTQKHKLVRRIVVQFFCERNLLHFVKIVRTNRI